MEVSSTMLPSRPTGPISIEDFMKARKECLKRMQRLSEELDNAMDELYDIGDCIIAKERDFAREREAWMAKHQHLRSLDMNMFFTERCDWETKFYNEHFKSLYDQRRDLARKIPCFWRDTLISNNKLFYKIRKKDGGALRYLNDIRSKRTPDLKGFELKFFFDKENPYFENEELTKTYVLVEDSKPVSLKAIGTKINWHPSKNVTKMHGESFFNFFKSFATIDDELCFDMEADELKGDLPDDFVIGRKIRDKIVRDATSWYFNDVENDSDFDEPYNIFGMAILAEEASHEEGQGP